MIYLYWPKKYIPSWLENITVTDLDACVGDVYHNGFGIVVEKGNKFHAYSFTGTVIGIENASHLCLNGGSRVVVIYRNFYTFISAITQSTK